jgi:diketogulonate reductase-like aldo/keto reductase
MHRSVALNTGLEMPLLGLGTFRAQGTEVKNAVKWALQAG